MAIEILSTPQNSIEPPIDSKIEEKNGEIKKSVPEAVEPVEEESFTLLEELLVKAEKYTQFLNVMLPYFLNLYRKSLSKQLITLQPIEHQTLKGNFQKVKMLFHPQQKS